METNEKTQSRNRVVLFPAEQLKPGDRKLVKIDKLEIAIINVDNNLYAFRNECPHQGISMIYGPVTGTMIPSNPKEYKYGLDDQLIKCPLHGWEFDLKTGKSLFSPNKVSLITYDVRNEDNQIVLYLKRESKSISITDFHCSLICN
ncbi:Rieske (2Fe-2S) protein [Bacillus salipaludis]|uniref:Rieske (2Fe-2S) protein n=1 Tax=Bacillus salipaludis TaxID=2547811 RepID=UPI001404EE30|nr:Rieske (2Fe-2S) protein [Bacillus salipaludis]